MSEKEKQTQKVKKKQNRNHESINSDYSTHESSHELLDYFDLKSKLGWRIVDVGIHLRGLGGKCNGL